MRRWAIPASLLLAAEAHAQPAADVTAAADGAEIAAPQHIGYGALPGGLHVQAAENLPTGSVELALLSGLGTRKGLLASGHRFNRAIGDVAVGYAPVRNLAIGLSFDGRYDKHSGSSALKDDGWVGDPHLFVRGIAPLGRLSLGAQVGVWVPGKDAPSIATSAISFDARAMLSVDAGFGVLSVNAGFRVDNSAESVDEREKLSLSDQVSLGVSDFNAAVVGAQLRVPLGRAYLGLEGSADIFTGSGAPGPIVRGGALVGVALNDRFSLVGYVEAAHVPDFEYRNAEMTELVLIPFESAVTAGVGLHAQLGGPQRASATRSQVVRNETPAPVTVVETADVSGTLVDDAGKPVVGAKVTVKLKTHTGTAISDDKGAFTVTALPIGKTVDGKTELDDTGAELAVEVANKKPATATLTLTRGVNAVPKIALEPLLPPGQLRAVIINVGTSRPVANATVTIDPGGTVATSGPDGKFTVDLPPGKYKITVNARGLAQQQLDVTIEQNGVAIKNIELHK